MDFLKKIAVGLVFGFFILLLFLIVGVLFSFMIDDFSHLFSGTTIMVFLVIFIISFIIVIIYGGDDL